MCLTCAGWTREEMQALQRDHIERFGWSIIVVEGNRVQAPFAYTIGLTRFHGHPELLVTGLDAGSTGAMLNPLSIQVKSGHRFCAGDVAKRDDGRLVQFVRVNNPRRLLHAQDMYASQAGLVPALQVVYSTPEGRWPWQRGWPGGRRTQPLFGKPVHR
ncbi:MAG TPA: DUF4262 domain-containing protein [Kineosporiaceae bacterium]|nr:DUF4262 domain-containing protein [Kineosporiaceae bacterium]